MILHPDIVAMIETMRRDLPGSLLLTGNVGIGLREAAHYVAGKRDTAALSPRLKDGSLNENGTITIEDIRGLYDLTRGQRTTPLVVIINSAEQMSHGAASAFLKLLEEPNDSTRFILTAHTPERLLPTIASRVQAIVLPRVTAEQDEALLDELAIHDSTKRAQMRFIASGLPAELTRLAGNEEYFRAKAEIVTDARVLLQGAYTEKLLMVKKYQENKARAIQIIDATIALLRRTVSEMPSKVVIQELERLVNASDKLARNASPRLQLLSVVLGMVQ